MKITYLHQYFTTSNMSGGTRSYEFARRLVNMGHDVNMITSWREPHHNKDWFVTNESGITTHWLPIPYSNHMTYMHRMKAFLSFAWQSALKAKSLEADIIFASSTPLTIALPSVYAARKKKVPLVFEVRDLWPQVPIAMKILKNPLFCFMANRLEFWAYKNANSIVALSPKMKQEIVKKNVNPNNIAVIPNCSDLEDYKFDKNLSVKFRNERPWLMNNPLFIYAGTFGKVNNLSYAIKLAKALKNQNSKIRILLIGDGIEKKSLINEAKVCGVLGKNLFFENQIQKKQMNNYFSAADMCANFVIDIKETWANSANKFFDSLAAGKPIFLNHGGWMQDLVSNYNCGLCMSGKDINIVAKELDIAMNDTEWLRSAGNSAKKLAIKFFDRNVLARQLEEVLVTTQKGKPELVEKIAKGIYI